MNVQTFASEAAGEQAHGRKTVQADSFLTLHYSISLENGTEIVSTFEDKPATLLLGRPDGPDAGAGTAGMAEGDRTTYRLAPEHGFGPRNPELLQRVSLATLRENSSFEEDYAPGDRWNSMRRAAASTPACSRRSARPRPCSTSTIRWRADHPVRRPADRDP